MCRAFQLGNRIPAQPAVQIWQEIKSSLDSADSIEAYIFVVAFRSNYLNLTFIVQ